MILKGSQDQEPLLQTSHKAPALPKLEVLKPSRAVQLSLGFHKISSILPFPFIFFLFFALYSKRLFISSELQLGYNPEAMAPLDNHFLHYLDFLIKSLVLQIFLHIKFHFLITEIIQNVT